MALAEPGGGPITSRTTAIYVGPKGGWSPAEVADAIHTVDLGPYVRGPRPPPSPPASS